jgi:ParB-like chromosome segregation protein Spo0J
VTKPTPTTNTTVEEHVPFDRLIPHPQNPNTGDTHEIARMIRKNGWHGALVVQRSTRHILAGNHRFAALPVAGYTDVPVVHWVDVDDATALRILVADNRASDLHTLDDRKLADLLKEISADPLSSLEGTGYTAETLAEMLMWDVPLEERDYPGKGSAVGADPGVEGRADKYRDASIRTMLLDLTIEQYETMSTQLSELRRRTGLPSNVEVIMQIVSVAFNTPE